MATPSLLGLIDPAVRALLDRHAVRRADGLPTVSVLVGPPGPGGRVWRAWMADRCAVLSRATADPPAVTAAVIDELARGRDLLTDACRFLSVHTGRPADELRAALPGMTARDRDDFFAAAEGQLPAGAATTAARWIADGMERVAVGRDPVSLLAGLAGLVPADALPAILRMPPADATGWFPRAGAAAVALAERVPALPIAVVVPAGAWAAYLADAPESRVKARLREGVVELPVLDEAAVARALAAAGVVPPELPPAAKAAAADGATAEFVRAFAAAAAAPTTAATAAESDRARSAAELALYELLEAIPETAGLFELNADPGFRFRSRRAEVDLLARSVRLAVEVDGYFHFRDADTYRRDREKDYDLQRHGFFVLRFLADDILVRLEDVRDRILAAVAARRPATEGPTT